jgi:hypothetical protein
MNKSIGFAAVLVLTLFAGSLFADEASMHKGMKMEKAKKSDAKTMKCEVVDVACYVKKGAKGEGHQGCAAKCISGGGELALLKDGKLYVPVDANFHSARKKFVSKGGETVEVKGTVISKDGVNYLQVE